MENLDLVARAVVNGFLIGLHNSPARGLSAEFAENRPYSPGDDPRLLDWKMYGRSDRLFVKQFEEETNLRAFLALDVSESMGWRSDPVRLVTKLDYARLLAACVALLLAQQGDATSLITFAGTTLSKLPPRMSRSHWRRITRQLEDLTAGGTTHAGPVLSDLASGLRRRSLVTLITDLLVDVRETREAVKLLRHRGHDVIILHIMDPGERELPPSGDAVFFDPETGAELAANSAALRSRYGEAVQEAVSSWRRGALAQGADYALMTTDTPPGLALRQFLSRRLRLR